MADVSAHKIRQFIKWRYPRFPEFTVQRVGDGVFYVALKVWDSRYRDLEPEIEALAREALGVKLIVST